MRQLLIFLFALVACSSAASASDFALKAQWMPNTETDIGYYTLYRTDGTRVMVNAFSHVNQPALPLPAHVECPFTVTVPEGTEPTMTFVLTATDTAGNTSVDSNPATYKADAKPPGKPMDFLIFLQ